MASAAAGCFYDVSSPDLGKILTFVDRVSSDDPCMAVFDLEIKPAGTTRWEAKVGFERLEFADAQ